MEDQSPSAELARLRKQQHKTRQNEVYGGLSQNERAEYDNYNIEQAAEMFEDTAG
jgi:hypothetical protein